MFARVSKISLLKIFVPGLLLAASFANADVDPIGQKAFYKAVKGSRTSSMIKSANADVTVTKFLPDLADGPAYEITGNYDADIRLYGRQSGTELLNVPAAYFSPDFLEKLRQDGTFESPDFKVKHLGFENVSTGNRSYENCDHLYFYDIKTDKAPTMLNFFIAAAFGKTPDSIVNSDIKDLKIYTKVKPGIPVLGAVQIDISGKYQGIAAKAGFDYIK